MPVHFVADWVSARVPSEYYATIAASLVAASFLKTWAAGPKLLEIEEDVLPPPGDNKAAPSQGGSGNARKDSATPDKPSSAASPPPLRDLHGRVVLVATGAFSALGVVTLSALAHRGAQIIALTPTLRSPRVHQLVSLLRSSTNNQLIYAEQCDMANLDSVSAFAAEWNKGDAATTGPGGGGKGGARRVDILLFLPAEETTYSIGEGVHPSPFHPSHDRAYVSEVLARFHLVNALLPSLLLLPPERDIRIVSAISPWYAAGAHSFDAVTLDPASPAYPLRTSEPWRIHGATSLRWYALMRELQRRLHLLAEADQRPRDKLPGIDPSSSARAKPIPVGSGVAGSAGAIKRRSNISCICIATGFERNSDVLGFLTPPSRLSEAEMYPDNGDEEYDEGEDDGVEETIASASLQADAKTDKLRAAIDPRRSTTGGQEKGRSGTSKRSRGQSHNKGGTTSAAALETLASLPGAAPSSAGGISGSSANGSPSPSTFGTAVRYVLILLLWPLIWLFTQSPATAADHLVWGMVKRVESDAAYLSRVSSSSAAAAGEAEEQAGGGGKKERTRRAIQRPLVGGELYRAGRIVRPTLPAHVVEGQDGWARLWQDEEERVERLLKQGVARPKTG